MKDLPIKARIKIALLRAGKTMDRRDLMRVVFPSDKYPRAFNYQANGGPPGCAMAFGRAIREMCGENEIWAWGNKVGVK